MGRRGAALLLAMLLGGTLLPFAGAEAPPERRLVSFEGPAPAEGVLLPGGARVVESFAFARVALVEGAPAALTALAEVPGVAGVYREEPLTPALDRARALVRADPPSRDAAWPDGAGVAIALVDSGIDFSHPGFAGRVAASVRVSRAGFVGDGDGDPDGHGTHVAGIAAGSGAKSDRDRLHGVAPGARLVGVDIRDAFTTTSAVRAFEWIHEHRHEHDVRVVSNSWGREKEDAHYDPDDPVVRASDALVADGLVVVFSAGNRGRDGASTLTTEASNPNVLAVGATSFSGRAESYSSRGPALDGDGRRLSWVKPDLVAPGSGIVSARSSALMPAEGGDEARHYTVMNGTSMAAPQVAGAAALLLQANPSLTPPLVQAILQQTARDVGAPGPDADTGYGLLDVTAALDAARTLGEGSREVVVETRIPIRHEGRVSGAQGVILLASGKPSLPPQQAVEVPFALPPGGVAVELWFNWTGSASFEVALHGPHGARAFERSGAASLRLLHPAREGAYRVVATPAGVAADAPYVLEGALVVHETRVVDAPAEFHARPGSLSPGGFLLPESGFGRALAVARGEPGLVLGMVVALSTVGLAWAVRRRG